MSSMQAIVSGWTMGAGNSPALLASITSAILVAGEALGHLASTGVADANEQDS